VPSQSTLCQYISIDKLIEASDITLVAGKSDQLQIRVTPADKAALKRLARRAGMDVSAYVLSRVRPAAAATLADLLRRLGREADRFALAEISDLLNSLAPAEFSAAVAGLDVVRLSPWLQNYVTAMIEQSAQQKGEPPPAWVHDVEPLERPWFAVSFASLRPYLLRVAPVAFKRRNLFVDATVGDRV
jgi:uncharacterized protein (DUF1778 family)